jgi:hypothetical protein
LNVVIPIGRETTVFDVVQNVRSTLNLVGGRWHLAVAEGSAPLQATALMSDCMAVDDVEIYLARQSEAEGRSHHNDDTDTFSHEVKRLVSRESERFNYSRGRSRGTFYG